MQPGDRDELELGRDDGRDEADGDELPDPPPPPLLPDDCCELGREDGDEEEEDRRDDEDELPDEGFGDGEDAEEPDGITAPVGWKVGHALY